ncbi:Pleckstrin homology domain-containing protein [Aspergillus karnatakaensis]|uniref:sporulation-specific 71 family protein n=1 Tax=Aspergillus karnatakaensis TaxID=1810916 RepID=UPI003CCD6CED
MSGPNTQNAGSARMDVDSQTPQEGLPGLEPGSYTLERLRHASANHVHMTSKRFFIGPIPKNWLQSHRKSWYRSRLNLRNYRSRAITFSAESDYARDIDPSRVADLPIAPEEDERDTEQEQDSSGQEPVQPAQDLRTLTRPIEENEEPPSPLLEGAEATSNSEDREGKSTKTKRDTKSAYYTARESTPSDSGTGQGPSFKAQPGSTAPGAVQDERSRSISGHLAVNRQMPSGPPSESGSTVPLLGDSQNEGKAKQRNGTSTALQQQEPERAISREGEDKSGHRRQDTFSRIATRFTLNDNLHNKQQRIASKISKTQSMVPEWLSRRRVETGEVIKAERMLVRVEETVQKELPNDYSEFDSLRMETRVQDNWREFLVVCRATSDKEAPFTLQMYKTRVIPKVQEQDRKASPYHEIALGRKSARMNLYSSLDKTIAVWNHSKRGTNIYILRPKSTTRAVEWYTFIAYTLGRRRTSSLGINVPDLAVSLTYRNPFSQLEAANNHGQGGRDSTSKSAMDDSAYLTIIGGCMQMLGRRPEWSAVIKEWADAENMGLAWKRYDRLEWVYGSNEEEMYGSLAMQGTHELELRPKQHYDTCVGYGARKEEEPAPVEGFLIRLTSQKGKHQRMNRMFSKRLYFFTQDQYLFSCKPGQALPPAPPRLCAEESDVPSTQQILDVTPLSFEIDPFPVQDGQISWLSHGNAENQKRQDDDAYAQSQRNIHNLSNAEGFINLCLVQEVRLIPEESAPSTQRDWNTGATEPESTQDTEAQPEENAGFEMLLDNGLVVRFQAYNTTTRDEWMNRLNALVKYWKARTAADAAELKETRQRNLDILGIDEELESVIGQYAKKWEVKKAEASSLLHNMCSLLGCRPIKISGQLYKKPRRHATFKRFYVVLTSGNLLVYNTSARKRNGTERPHIQSTLESSIDLSNCYIYSGLLTENDLLYSNQTFDSNHPGHGALPRVYLSADTYTSSDEDTAITFVIWQPLRKGLFRAREMGEGGGTRQTLKQVSKLGVHGRTIVFKARSRVEKDQWVLAIASEIDRLQEGKGEDVRLIES